jgi:hypothetical protein
VSIGDSGNWKYDLGWESTLIGMSSSGVVVTSTNWSPREIIGASSEMRNMGPSSDSELLSDSDIWMGIDMLRVIGDV